MNNFVTFFYYILNFLFIIFNFIISMNTIFRRNNKFISRSLARVQVPVASISVRGAHE